MKIKKLLIACLTFAFIFTLFGCAEMEGGLLSITFDYGDGNAVEIKTIYNQEIYERTAQKDGYVFVGWYDDIDLTKEHDFSVGVTEDITVYAKWLRVNTVSFDTNGSTTTYESVVVNTGDSVVLPDAVLKENTEFVCWSDGLSTYNPGDQYVVSSDADVVIKAVYKNNKKVTFLGANDEVVSTQYVETVDELVYPDAVEVKIYEQFIGWEEVTTPLTQDTTIKAVINPYVQSADEYFNYVGYKKQETVDGYELIATTVEEEIEVYKAWGNFQVAAPEVVILPKTYNGKEVVGIPESTASASAFGNLNNLDGQYSTIVIPNNYTEIPAYAFYHNYSIEEVIFEENSSVKEIGNYAFGGYNNKNSTASLKKVTLPKSVETLGNYAFSYMPLAEFTIEEGSVLNSIGQYCFVQSGNTTPFVTMESFVIPNTVEEIGMHAFASTTYNITLENGSVLKQIGNYAFQNTTKLTEFVLPEGLETIGNSAFYRSTYQDGYIPASVSSIGSSAFKECPNLTAIEIAPSADVKLSIGNDAFAGSATTPGKIVDLVIPAKVVSIGNNAFSYNSALETITIEDGTDELTIGNFAFAGYTSTSSITTKDLYTNKVTTVVLPSRVKSLGQGCFMGNYFLETVDLSQTKITDIANYTFAYCKNIKEVNLPTELKTIGTYGFASYYDVLTYVIADNKIVVPGYNKALTSITLPYTLTKINTRAFDAVTSLKTITFEETPSDKTPVALSLESYAFSAGNGMLENTQLTVLEIPGRVTKIGSSAFTDYTKLVDLTINEGVVTIDSSAFNGCTSLVSVEIPGSVTAINASAFADCTKLASVIFAGESKGLKVLANAFANTVIEEITFPTGLASVLATSFNGNTTLKEINVPASNTVYSSVDGFLYNKATTKLLIVPTYYKSTMLNIKFLDSVVEIDANVFTGFSALNSVDFNNVTKLGNYAFSECPALTSVDISKVTTVGTNLFRNCLNLNSVKLNESLATVSANMFYGCAELKEVTLPDSVTKVDGSAFYNAGLEKINFSENLSYIGGSAFRGTNLVNVYIPGNLSYLGATSFTDIKTLKTIVFEGNISAMYNDPISGFFETLEDLEYIVFKGEVKPFTASVELGEKLGSNFKGVYFNDEYYAAAVASTFLKSEEFTEKVFKLSERPAESYLEGEKTVSITVNLNYAGATEQTVMVVTGAMVAAPTREGFEFLGWFNEETLETEVNTCLFAEQTVYAKWEAVEEVA